MADNTLTIPADPSTLAVLPPSDLALPELITWEVMLPVGADGRPIVSDDVWMAIHRRPSGSPEVVRLDLVPLRSLFRGDRVVQEFGSTPPPEYDLVFACIERPLARFAAQSVPCVRDVEFEKLFSELRRRPDGRYQSALYRYAQAVLRLLLHLRPTSASEFDALLRRLARSARVFSTSVTSTNYFSNVLEPLLHV